MKKLLFTIVFLSVISFIGISKVNALPTGGPFTYWDSNKVLVGNLIDDLGSQLPLYGYNGSGYGSCPYLGITNELAPLSCYNQSEYGSNTSLLVNSYPLCAKGNCITAGSVMNLTIGLSEQDFLQANTQYNLQVDIGMPIDVSDFWFEHLKSIYDTGRNFQLGYGITTDYKVECYKSSDDSYYSGQNYCSISFNFVPDRTVGVFYVDFSTDMSLADFNAYATWMTYPKIEVNDFANYVKYSITPSQEAYVSGLKNSKVYFEMNYFIDNNPYVMYYDLDEKDGQPSTNWIKDFYYTSNDFYFYNEYHLDWHVPPADLILVTTERWNDITGGFPYKTLDFYVHKDAYVDIITPSFSEAGIIRRFRYKNADTGVISEHISEELSLGDGSSFFGVFKSALDFFKSSILNVGTIFSTFFNSLPPRFGWYFVCIFSFGVLSVLIILFK